jgi:hypothetical protein
MQLVRKMYVVHCLLLFGNANVIHRLVSCRLSACDNARLHRHVRRQHGNLLG